MKPTVDVAAPPSACAPSWSQRELGSDPLPNWTRHCSDAFHLLRERNERVVHDRARVVSRVHHNAVHTPPLHAEVARIVQGEHRGLAQIAMERVLHVERVDAYHLHALVHAVEQHLGAMNLAYRTDDLTVGIVSIHVVRGLETERPSGFNLRGDVTENI